jgi:class 3 adenylate cyclase
MDAAPHELGRYAPEGIDRRRVRLALQFVDHTLEASFQADMARRLELQQRLGLILAVSLWAVAVLLLPLVYGLDRLVVAISVIPAVAAEVGGIAMVGRAQTWRAQQVVEAGVNLVGGSSMVVITTMIADLPALLAPALLLNAIFAFGVVRIGWVAGVVAAIPPLVWLAALAMSGSYPGIDWFSVFVVASGTGVSAFGAWMLESSSRVRWLQERALEEQGRELTREMAKSDDLLRNMLPASVVGRLRDGQGVIADGVSDASVVFADLVGFTHIGSRLSPATLVSVLSELFARLDELAVHHGLEKIKTIGDGYMAVAGVPEPVPDHAERAVLFGAAIPDVVADVAAASDLPLIMRVGIHSGPLVAGVIGRSRLAYDLWGDTVNLASRMESHGLPGRVQVTEATARLLPPHIALESRGAIKIRGHDPVVALLVVDTPGRSPVSS